MMHSPEWLASLSPGVDVAIASSFGSGYSIATVVRRDKVKIVVRNHLNAEEIFSARNGRTMGSDRMSARSLTPLTESLRASIHRARLVRRVENETRWDKLPTASLEAVCAILSDAGGTKP